MNPAMENFEASPRTRTYEEKRDFIRMRVLSPALIEDAHGERKKGICHNLSGGGALMEFPKGYSVNEHIKLTIESHHGHAPMLTTMARIVRAEPGTTVDTALIAVTYLKDPN